MARFFFKEIILQLNKANGKVPEIHLKELDYTEDLCPCNEDN